MRSVETVEPVSLWSVVIMISAVVAGLMVLTNTPSAARFIIVVGFLLVCPGMMFVRFFNFNEPLVEWMLAIALSLVVDAVVPGLMLAIGRWSTTGAFTVILGLTVLGVIAQEARASLVGRPR